MPHLTLQYTDNIQRKPDFAPLFSRLHDVLSEVGGIQIGNCKSRAIRLEDYFVARGGPEHAFIHLDIAVLAGRSVDLKQEIGRFCLEALNHQLAPSFDGLELQITVEIRDMPKDAYFKIPEGTLTPL